MTGCVWLRHCCCTLGKLRYGKDGREIFHPLQEQWIKGFVQLLAEDCRWLFRHGKVNASLFHTLNEPKFFIQPPLEKRNWLIEPLDLQILRKDVEQFEQQFKVERTLHQQLIGREGQRLKSFWHSDNYQSVLMGGREFRFGFVQAEIIRALHQASFTDNPWVHGKILLDKAGSRSEQIKNVFSGKPYWRECVLSDGRGYYRLNL
ncbi:MAG: hypothetical protein DWQ02_12180 [Bacteroidetes bacterium]|nr:MAG: hypothetical protein DWQ02_12180 [Bacteroidota bacterium]